MITFFTTAKPFIGQNRITQTNAIKSWQSLCSEIEIILFGDGEGYSEISRNLGLIHAPEVQVSDQGTPLINSMFDWVKERAHHPLRAYVNCDIILLDDFIPAVTQINVDRFLMIGQRWDTDLNWAVDFENTTWSRELLELVRLHGELHPPYGSDYFVYRGDIWEGIPTLVVGRGGYDNELIYHCLMSGTPVFDATEVTTVVHQNHGYAHHPQGKEGIYRTGEEARLNRSAGAARGFVVDLTDADWRLSPQGPVKNYCRGNWKHYFEITCLRNRETSMLWRLVDRVLSLYRRFKTYSTNHAPFDS